MRVGRRFNSDVYAKQHEQKRLAVMEVERHRLKGILVASVVVGVIAAGIFAIRVWTQPTPAPVRTPPSVANSEPIPGTSPQTAAVSLPELTQPVNDFARVIDAENATAMDRVIRELQAKTGDVLVVATVPTIEPYGDIREYALELFENHGRGIGEKAKNNGGLILLAVKERRVRIEVGAGLAKIITNDFADQAIRGYMVPEFAQGHYAAGLRDGAELLAGCIALGSKVTLDSVPVPDANDRCGRALGTP